MIGRLLFIGLGISIVMAGSKAKAAYDLSYQLAGIVFDSIQAGYLYAILEMNVQNASTENLTFSSLNADILIKDSRVGQVRIQDQATIAGNATTLLKIPIRIQLSALGKTALGLFANPKLPAIQIKGTMVASGINFPIDETYSG